MTGAIPDILNRIVDYKRAELAARGPSQPQLARMAEAAVAGRRPFAAALRQSPPAIIAECKKASPSKGLLATGYNPATVAAAYQEGGAAALSVLTDEKFFQGSLADLQAARAAVSLPVLRKDFTLDEFHVIEAAAHGADAVLLIAAILPAKRIRSLRELSAQFQMDAIVEVHNDAELDVALSAGASIIGVNNRNLHTFEVMLDTSLHLADRIPSGILRISESGIHTLEDVRTLRSAGYHAFLVGEYLMKSGSPAEAVRALRA